MSASIEMHKITRLEYKRLARFPLVYGVASTKYGNCLMGLHQNRLCYSGFFDGEELPMAELEATWPRATLTRDDKRVSQFFNSDGQKLELLVKGTNFETTVWETLLKLEKGKSTTYGEVAKMMCRQEATRAVARAIAKNHVGFFVPCHRVIRKDGNLGEYRWGTERKLHLLQDEGAL